MQIFPAKMDSPIIGFRYILGFYGEKNKKPGEIPGLYYIGYGVSANSTFRSQPILFDSSFVQYFF